MKTICDLMNDDEWTEGVFGDIGLHWKDPATKENIQTYCAMMIKALTRLAEKGAEYESE